MNDTTLLQSFARATTARLRCMFSSRYWSITIIHHALSFATPWIFHAIVHTPRGSHEITIHSEIFILGTLSSGSSSESWSKTHDSVPSFASSPLSPLSFQHPLFSTYRMFRSLVSRYTAASSAWETGILRWSTVYTASWTPWSDCRQKRRRMVLSVSFVLSMVVVRVMVTVTAAVTVAVAVAVAVAVTVAVMFSCSSHGILFAERGLIGGRTRHEGRQPLVRSSPRGVFSSRCARVLGVRQPALLFCCSPRGAFLTSFSASSPPSSAHLSTFNPLARSRSSARPSRS